jgi:GWxTD domain-containing protein
MNKKIIQGFFPFFSCWVILSTVLAAQPGYRPPSGRFVMNVSHNRFKQSDTSAFLEIATAFYMNQIRLRRDTAGYHGAIDESIVIRRKQDAFVVDAGRFSIPVDVKDSALANASEPIVSKYYYTLGFGTYAVHVIGNDVLDPLHRDSSAFEVSIVKVPKSIAVSDVELSSSITESTDRSDMFYKNSYRVIPNPGALFGRDNAPVVYSYCELYNLSPDSLYSITARIADGKGTVLKHQTRVHRYSAPNVVDVNSLNATSIPSGKYTFALVIADTSGREIARSEKNIFIYNPQIALHESAAISEKTAEFAGLTNDELADEFRQAQYVASSDDIKAFEKLTTAEARREFLAKFWTRVENTQDGQTNLTRATYLERVTKANQRYSIMGRPGWHTDRGRVYILYGQPDEVQRFPSSQDSKPYEIWNYYSLENGVIFVFIDLRGFGNYELVHSTKRGELQDEGWEQYLR